MRNSNTLNLIPEEYLKKLTENERILGVAVTGSYSRNDSDEYSDIDYVVFTDEDLNGAGIKEGKFFYNNSLFDSRTLKLMSLEESVWSQDMYFAYLNCSVIYDKTGAIKEMLDKKRTQWESNLIRQITLALVDLSVIFELTDNWRGLKADSHYLKYLKRKDFISAHRALSMGFELILDLFYLLNKRPIPDIKNKVRLLVSLTWIPKELDFFLTESTLILEKSMVDCDRRYKIMISYIEIIKKYIDKNVALDSDLYKYYLTNR